MANLDELKKHAQKLGVPVNSAVYKPTTEAWVELQITEYELHRRIREEERHRREHRLWIAALVSAGIAILAAIAAWLPLILKR
jgi:hypothetical protein